MDAQFEWRDEYNVGVESIDKEHRRLFGIINKLFTVRAGATDSQWTGQSSTWSPSATRGWRSTG